MTKKEILPITLIIISLIIGIFLYPQLPEKVPSHWNVEGEVDAWSSKNFAVFFFPALTLGLYFLMTFIPLIDPLRKNYPKFALPYFWFRLLFVLFFISLYLYTLGAAFGTRINIKYFMVPLLSIFLILLGVFLPKIKKNYFVGIRTPWTIHSEETWEKTHKFGAKIFIGAGIAVLLTLILPGYTFWIFIIIILSAALIPAVYSYFVFRRIGGFNK